MDNLEELERLLAKATPGEWIAQSTDTEGPDYGVCIVAENLGGLVAAALPWPTEIDKGDFARVEANAALIVALRNAAPSLIATAREVEGLRVENERLPRDLVDTKAEYHRVSEVALDLSREADELRAEIARLIGLVKEAGEMLVMFLRHKTSTGDDCFTFRLTTEHIRWSEAALAKIKENLNA